MSGWVRSWWQMPTSDDAWPPTKDDQYDVPPPFTAQAVKTALGDLNDRPATPTPTDGPPCPTCWLVGPCDCDDGPRPERTTP